MDTLPLFPPLLQRTLSHEDQAELDAALYFEQCGHHDTIFANYWMSNGWIDYTFFRKEINSFVKYHQNCHVNDLPTFTFYVQPVRK